MALKRILKIAESGLPLHFCAQAGNITSETLLQWRKQDPQFDQLLQMARLKAVEQRWQRIERAAKGTTEHPPDWKADAWSLERTYPQFFGRPDLQLSVNQSVSSGPTNVVILGPERASVLANRYQAIRAKTIELFSKGGNGEREVQPPTAEVQPAAETQPPDRSTFEAALPLDRSGGLSESGPEPSCEPAAWWRPFIFGGALIAKADATRALQLILNELSIPADERSLAFQTDHVAQRTFCEVLEKLTGGELGWRTMVQIYERELQRAGN